MWRRHVAAKLMPARAATAVADLLSLPLRLSSHHSFLIRIWNCGMSSCPTSPPTSRWPRLWTSCSSLRMHVFHVLRTSIARSRPSMGPAVVDSLERAGRVVAPTVGSGRFLLARRLCIPVSSICALATPRIFRREENIGIEDARRVKALFDATHELDLDGVFELEEVRGFGAARPCSPEIAPPNSIASAKMSVISCLLFSGSLQKMARCTLPSPACPQPTATAPAVAARSRAAEINFGIAPRGTTVSMISSAPIAFIVQNAFSRASISLRAEAPSST